MLSFIWDCTDHVLALFGRVIVVTLNDENNHIERVHIGYRKNFVFHKVGE